MVAFRSSQSQMIGTKFKLWCTTQYGNKPLSFKWRKNDNVLSSNNDQQQQHQKHRYHIEILTDESVLTIFNVEQFDSGNYSCQVYNHFGSDIQFTVLTVQG